MCERSHSARSRVIITSEGWGGEGSLCSRVFAEGWPLCSEIAFHGSGDLGSFFLRRVCTFLECRHLLFRSPYQTCDRMVSRSTCLGVTISHDMPIVRLDFGFYVDRL